MTALRLSAILSILVAAFYTQGLVTIVRFGGPLNNTIWLLLVGIVVPLVPGVLALFNRATFLLPAAWGWALGVHLPKLLIPRPPLPMDLIRQTLKTGGGQIFVVGPDYFGMALVAVAIVGLALCCFSYYREQTSPTPLSPGSRGG
jgi:hypothetical protein